MQHTDFKEIVSFAVKKSRTILLASSHSERRSFIEALLVENGYRVCKDICGDSCNDVCTLSTGTNPLLAEEHLPPSLALIDAPKAEVVMEEGLPTLVLATMDQMALAADALAEGAFGIIPCPDSGTPEPTLILTLVEQTLVQLAHLHSDYCIPTPTQASCTFTTSKSKVDVDHAAKEQSADEYVNALPMAPPGAPQLPKSTTCSTCEMDLRERAEEIIYAERLTAASQIVQNLSQAMQDVVEDAKCAEYVAQLPTFATLHDRNRQIVAANTAFTDRFGSVCCSGDIYQSRSDGQWISPVEETLRDNTTTRRCEPVVSATGEDMPALIYTFPISGTAKEPDLALEIAVDVSQVEFQQQKLLTAQRKYRQLFDESPCYITVQDKDLRIVDANHSFRRDFNYEQDCHCFNVYKQSDSRCEDCPIIRTFEDGEHHQTETVVTGKNGQPINLLVRTAPIRDEEGNITHVIELGTDITEVRHLQDRLSSLGVMLGSMAHGLKGLLMAIDGGAYKIDSGIKRNDPERVVDGWRQVKDKIGRMRKLSLDILYYAKDRELEYQDISLSDFITDLEQAISHKTSHHGITLTVELAENCSEVTSFTADETALHAAMINFLENAIDACVFNRSQENPSINLQGTCENGAIVLTIQDNGIGMDEEMLNNMFTLFFSSKGANGTGIGLYVSHQTITAHGGTIEATSTVGEGTTFIITLPQKSVTH